MPNINRIRVNNVKYNFGSQSYDDFIMKPFGKNMLYDLANGGGKSVLMLLMLQTVLPNCTLDDKQPIEKLFRTNEGSQTIHSLIEWKLDKKDINNGFMYMTTGFCAKKAITNTGTGSNNVEQPVSKDTASIEYFNYCIFYREYNNNDIRNIPLVKGNEKKTYGGLRKYLKELERDNSLVVKIFDRKGEYQNFIAGYGLYESEWEIIRGINKTEGHVRTYFESNYKTTRKVVEDLLIEEIIEKSFRYKSGNHEAAEMMSRTLLDIKDRLLELSKKKEELGCYDRQIEVLTYFSERIGGMLHVYGDLAACEKELIHTYGSVSKFLESKSVALESLKLNYISLKEQLYERTKTIDAAKYIIDKSEASDISEEIKELEQEIIVLNKKHAERKHQRNLKESFNDYLEYQQEKKKKEETTEAIEAIKNNNTDIMKEIQCLTYHLKHRFSSKQKKLMEELHHLEGERNVIREEAKSLDHKLRLLDNELAISNSRYQHADEAYTMLSQDINKIKQAAGVLIIENVEELLDDNTKKAVQLNDQKKELENTLVEYEPKIVDASIKIAKYEAESTRTDQQIEEMKAFFNEYDQAKRRVDGLGMAYGMTDYYNLKNEIKARYKNNIKTVEEKEKWKKSVVTELKRLKDKTFLSNKELLSDVIDYIKIRKNMVAITGEEYLFSLNDEERVGLIRQYPFLPYSIVIRQGYESVKADTQLSEHIPENVVLPIFEEKALNHKKDIIDMEYMYLLSQDQSILFDDVRLEKEINRKEKELEELNRQIIRLLDQETTYMDDETFVQDFIIKYYEKYHEQKEKEQMYLKNKEEVNRLLSNARMALEQLILSKANNQEERKAIEIEILDCNKTMDYLKELSRLYRESKEQEQLLKKERYNKDQLLSQQQKTSELYGEQLLKQRALDGACEDKQEELKTIQSLWTEKYQQFFVEGIYPDMELSDDELIAKLNGMCIAFTSEHTDLEDKNRLVHSYVNVMNRCLKSISNRGISTTMLKDLQEKGEVYLVKEDELSMIYEEVKEYEKQLGEKTKRLEEKKANYHHLDGKMCQALSLFEEKYGKMTLESLDSENAKQAIEQNKQQILLCQHKIKIFEEDQRKLEDAIAKLSDMKKDMERAYKNSSILSEAINNTSIDYEKEELLYETYQNLSQSYEKLQLSLKEKREEFLRNKDKTIETLRILSAEGLADEIRDSVAVPQNEEDTLLLMSKLQEVNECLSLEKVRIERGIEDMQQMKDNFENQCLQRCIHIKTELERLSKLSKIMLDGEQINIIHLNIPYVKEEFVKEKMSIYIDEIVRGVDEYQDNQERLRFIRNALSLKKLFSVVVTDMNNIKLALYKRERIKEQSKHLRYEEAVGSTGQSQGIYIQFLIAIINYISNINSGNLDHRELLKVIFIDNPFGAAKDVYIWEPIFELLKTNHVQLIVPARGATPAITGRFDVNYVLGQKIIDGRQQTVVIDYQSRVDTKEVEYIPLQYEQTSMDMFDTYL